MTKAQLIKKLKAHYGEGFKSPLAKDLDVSRKTVQRLFNERLEIPTHYMQAIENILNRSE